MARSRSGTTPMSYRGLAPTYSAAAVEFARLDGNQDSSPAVAMASGHRSSSADHAGSTRNTLNHNSNQVQAQTQNQSQQHSIRFCAHFDTRSQRPSLQFGAISRVVPSESSVIKVGRYSEREEKAAGRDLNQGSVGPVGFKSKVVSRRHCEFWCKDGQWYIKDCASSSGTFLNHIRLSQPNIESRPFPVSDGDVVQLGIDFKGGEEMIFRCVKIRIETNRGWQNSLNNFNMKTHKQLRSITKGPKNLAVNPTGPTQSTECSICLNAVAPCQSLFVAPCSHVWHFKCIRPILNGPMWPQFLCPNCRAVSDLEAEVDEPIGIEEWQDEEDEVDGKKNDVPEGDKKKNEDAKTENTTNGVTQAPQLPPASPFGDWIQADARLAEAVQGFPSPVPEDDGAAITPQTVLANGGGNVPAAQQSTEDRMDWTPESQAIPIPGSSGRLDTISNLQNTEGPLTPRNNAGPFVFDGSAGRENAQPNGTT